MNAARLEVAPGITLADVDRAARLAVGAAFAQAGDYADRYDTAWSAAAELAWTADPPPTVRDMAHAGMRAVDRWVSATHSFRGHSRPDRGGGPLAGAVRYWREPTLPTPSPENGAVERLAVAQILPALTDRQREALWALATAGTHAGAAERLGITLSAFQSRVYAARGKFLALWHEGEEPSAVWREDRRTAVRDGGRNARRNLARAVEGRAGRRALPPHGTASRYGKHGCHCLPCTDARTEQKRSYRKAAPVPRRPRYSSVTAAAFAAMRVDREAGLSLRRLAERYGTNTRTVGRLLRGEVEPAPDVEGKPGQSAA